MPLKQILLQLAACVVNDGTEHLPEVRFLDWLSRNDVTAIHVGLQGLLSWCFECGRRLAVFLQDSELERLCSSVRSRLLRAALPVTANKSASAMLALGGYQTDGSWHCKNLKINQERDISTFFGYFVLEAKSLCGDLDGAMQLIRNYWGAMLDFGATTFWEDFDLEWTANACPIDQIPQPGQKDIHGDFGKHCYTGLRHSLCHGWASGPTAFISEHILGVKPVAPGFSQVEITPAFAGLEYISGSVPTPYGKIEVEGEAGKWKCNIPDGIKLINPSNN